MYPDLDINSETGGEARVLTLRDVLAPIFRYRRAGVTVALLLSAVALLVVLLLPRRYDAEMTLLVKRERADTIVSPDPGASSQGRADVTEEELNSEVELLQSRDLLEQIATSSGVVPQGSAQAATDGHREALARAVRKMAANLTVSPLRKTTLIKVVYRSSDPVQSAKVLSELGRLYLDRHLALHRPVGAYQFFSAQTDRFHDELNAAEAQLKAYGRREDVVSAVQEQDNTLRQLADFEALLQQTRAQVADGTRRILELQNTAAATPARQTTQVKTLDNPQLMAQLRSKVLDLELKRTDMLRKFTPAYPPVVELEGQLAQARAALELVERTPPTEQTTDENPTHQWAQNELARVKADRGAALARADAIASSVRLYRDKARQLEEKGTVQQELKRTIKSAEDNYLLYLRKQEEARISDALDRTRISNVAIAQAPTVPALPSSSGRSLMLLIGLFVACLAGVATTFVLDYVSPYFHTPEDVETALDLPVLATLPAGR